MTDTLPRRRFQVGTTAAALLLAAGLCAPLAAQPRDAVRAGDYIVAVVNQELVTAGEVERRLEQARTESARRGAASASSAEDLRRQALDSLVEERVIVTHARESGARVDEPDLDRAIHSIAQQNQLSMAQLRERLRQEGIDYARFRADLRDQMMVERVREREVYQRIHVTDLEVDRLVEQQRAAAQADAELDIAQILVTVPEGAGSAEREQRRKRAEQALARVRGGEDFAAVARELSEDANREQGGRIGLRPASRLPDLFLDAVRPLVAGEVAASLVSSGAGYHVLKLLERRDGAALRVPQTHARHILLRTSAQLSTEAAVQRLQELRSQIEQGSRGFDEAARQFSDDGSAAGGGDLGWTGPGQFVPEFEEAMNRLVVGGISPPVASRFGVHLIQVLERREVALQTRQLRDQARALLRERKFAEAYAEWARDLRARAYVEMREPPL
ncbi:MAG: molecular chaperone SurA [Rubrivivax sp. SCN 71-131]|jgi:peptidyl-prolyl cis-trans isomerase SurA|nr:MAG: molecular chaperone SurA [Rubrivivax sp. SCN 71-131]